MTDINFYIPGFLNEFPEFTNYQPWNFLPELSSILLQRIEKTDSNFDVKNGIAIHKTAIVEGNVTLKAPIIIGENCFIGAHAYLRDGVFLGKSCTIGPCCEIKRSIILNGSTIAHFNFIGDSIIGNRVNFEAGAITANHFNEKTIKTIL
ncbi:MAG: LpxA family transferase, partial [Bacteroidales bacterium]|nr:LpxA family transferase [Bacteroidales bacterium]